MRMSYRKKLQEGLTSFNLDPKKLTNKQEKFLTPKMLP